MKRKTLDRIGLLFVALVMISPVVLFFLWMISLSLKYEIDNGAYPPVFIPERLAWSNYLKVFEENNFFLYLWNSVLVTGAATLLALLIGVPAGYGIARLKAEKSAMVIMDVAGEGVGNRDETAVDLRAHQVFDQFPGFFLVLAALADADAPGCIGHTALAGVAVSGRQGGDAEIELRITLAYEVHMDGGGECACASPDSRMSKMSAGGNGCRHRSTARAEPHG